MKHILVTGANGQLGKCLFDASRKYPETRFTFVAREELDITNKEAVSQLITSKKITHCINTAAYTNVDKAESEKELAFLVNAEAVKNLAEVTYLNKVIFYHISTDYVFNGTKKSPYLETDEVSPINVYGASKLKGEEYITKTASQYFIIRTSWLYSQYGHNFMNSMIRFAKQGRPLTITTEQTGAPTNANDLAKAILRLIERNTTEYGTYHYSNTGKATWYDFAKAILKETKLDKATTLGKTDYYPTFAKRPEYSILDVHKIEQALGQKTNPWEKSLASLIKNNRTNLL